MEVKGKGGPAAFTVEMCSFTALGTWDKAAGHALSVLCGEFFLAGNAGHYLSHRLIALISASVIPIPPPVDSCVCAFTFCILF